MALLNRPLSAGEVESLLRTPYYPPSDIFRQMLEPRRQTVRYRGALDRVDYERPDTFYALGPKSPSDCVWMVPCGIATLVSR